MPVRYVKTPNGKKGIGFADESVMKTRCVIQPNADVPATIPNNCDENCQDAYNTYMQNKTAGNKRIFNKLFNSSCNNGYGAR
jgi:hypothetical protein